MGILRLNRFKVVQDILGDSGRAAIQRQGSTSNPFGSTFVYGYPNIALEVNPWPQALSVLHISPVSTVSSGFPI